ncbi:MAG: hypothetical protein ACKOPS_03725, partial [Cyanobium sp.]
MVERIIVPTGSIEIHGRQQVEANVHRVAEDDSTALFKSRPQPLLVHEPATTGGCRWNGNAEQTLKSNRISRTPHLRMGIRTTDQDVGLKRGINARTDRPIH